MHRELSAFLNGLQYKLQKNHVSLFLCFGFHYHLFIYRRTVVSIPCGPSALAVKEAAWGLARYAAISQVCFGFT